MFITDNTELLLSEIIPIEEHYDGMTGYHSNITSLNIITILGLIGIAAPVLYFSKLVRCSIHHVNNLVIT